MKATISQIVKTVSYWVSLSMSIVLPFHRQFGQYESLNPLLLESSMDIKCYTVYSFGQKLYLVSSNKPLSSLVEGV